MRGSRRLSLAFACLALVLLIACGGGDRFTLGPPLEATPTAPAIPDDPRPAPGIDVPEGFVAYLYAEGLKEPTSLAFHPDGRLFVTELRGRVVVIEDADGDGLGDAPAEYWSDDKKPFTLGAVVAPDGSVFISVRGRVLALRDDGAGRAEAHTIVSGLPNRVHQNNGLAFGPDGLLYITLGSTCNLCHERDERSATILRANPDGSDLQVHARGLRNPYDIAFDSEGGLWATANEHDFYEPAQEGFRVLDDPPEELNYIVEGADYGWPACAGDGREMLDGGCEGVSQPVALLAPHSSSDGLAIYAADAFPPEYRGDLFVAQYGSDPRNEVRTGREVVRVRVTPAGAPGEFESAVTTFASGFANPLDVTVDAAGTLFVADFGSGDIYRIVWLGG